MSAPRSDRAARPWRPVCEPRPPRWTPRASSRPHARPRAAPAPPHPAPGVEELLPGRVERMARRADLDVDLALRRTGDELVAARARDVRFYVIRMDSLLLGPDECG